MMDMSDFLNNQFASGDSLDHLLLRARAMLARTWDAVLAEYDITRGQGLVLWLLSSGKISTAADLARQLDIDAASMTRMIDRLEKRKLMARLPRGDDRRMVNLCLTPSGQLLAEKLPSAHAAVMQSSFSGFSIDDLRQLRILLSKLLANAAPQRL
jgi:DNA-binding MarR family transcriptional regulator